MDPKISRGRIRVGERVTFRRTIYDPGEPNPALRERDVEGTIISVNEAHNHYAVAYTLAGRRMVECFKFA